MNINSSIIAPITIGLIFIGCVYFLFYKENYALQIHAQLESLKIEIEIDINNEDYSAASNKLIKLVHPSPDYSAMEYEDDVNSKGFWNGLVKNGNSKYRYNEYWKEQRTILLEKVINAKKNQISRITNAENY